MRIKPETAKQGRKHNGILSLRFSVVGLVLRVSQSAIRLAIFGASERNNIMDNVGVNDGKTIKRILRFFRSKRNLTSKEVDHEVADMRISRLQEEVYNVDEVENILEDLNATLQGSVREHMERTAYMAVLLVRQLFKGGAENGINLVNSINLPQLEDHEAIAKIKRFDNDAVPADTHDGIGSLSSVADENRRLVEKISDLEDSNDDLREKYNAKVDQCKSLLLSQKEMRAKFKMMKTALRQLKSALRKERKRVATSITRDSAVAVAAAAATAQDGSSGEDEDASDRSTMPSNAEGKVSQSETCVKRSREGKDAMNDDMTTTGEEERPVGNHTALVSRTVGSDGKIAALLREIDSANARIGEADRELERIRGASKKRIASSKQFQLMRRLLGRKNEQIREFRRRLEEYEPERVSKMGCGDSDSD